jgi:hypothetical protein
MPPSTSVEVAPSMGVCPDRNRNPFDRIPWEYGPMAAAPGAVTGVLVI